MKVLLLILLVISISNCQQNVNMNQFYSFWDTCQEELLKFSLWFNTANENQIRTINLLIGCSERFTDEANLNTCKELVEQYEVIDQTSLEFYNGCYEKRFRFQQTQVFNETKCKEASHKCVECSLNSECDSFKKAFYSRYREFQKSYTSTEPEYCPNLLNCQREKIGYFAEQICMMYYQNECKEKWILQNAQDDECFDMQFCNPFETINTPAASY